MIQGNQKDCSNTVKNLGVPDCIINNGRITGMIAVDPSWSVDVVSGTLTQADINDLIQDGTFIPVLGAVEVVNGTPEATTEEYQGGIMSVVRNGLLMLTFKFLKGWAYARALYSMNSFQSYKLLLVFEDGSIAGVLNGTTFSAYSLGMFNTGTFFHTDGSVSGYVNTVVQLTSTEEYNLNTYVIDKSELGFNANNLFPITDIILTGRAVVSEQKVYFKAHFDMNQGSTLGGIAIANLKSYVDGVSDTVTADSLSYNATTDEYEYTPTATITTSSSIVTSLYDETFTIAVAKIGVKYYKGATAAITPAENIPTVPVITSSLTVSGTIGTPLTYNVTATNTPTSYSKVGTLPPGLTLNTTTGVVSGTPTGVANSAVVLINATNADGTGSAYVTFTIVSA